MDTIKPLIGAYFNPASTLNGTQSTAAEQSAGGGPAAAPPPSDTVQFSPAAIEVAKYSSLTRQIQDGVSPERMAALKKAVSTGTYPSPLVTEGLLALVGSALANTQ